MFHRCECVRVPEQTRCNVTQILALSNNTPTAHHIVFYNLNVAVSMFMAYMNTYMLTYILRPARDQELQLNCILFHTTQRRKAYGAYDAQQ